MKKSLFVCAIVMLAISFVKAQGVTIEANSAVKTTVVIAQKSEPLQEYAGKYAMKENAYIQEAIVFMKDGKLMTYNLEKEEIALEPKEADNFYIESLNAKVVFSRENGAVKGLKILVQGMTMEGEKK